MKYDAVAFSLVGDQYLGRAYSEMDCQAFVEQCLKSVGCTMDLKGSNAWFRKVQQEGWTGSPEECVKQFGCVPKGAFLFIHAFDGGEEKRGYHDGKGNASHIGIKTGRGKGAIHSSASRGCVAESEFHDKTIRNGGWNMVGLWNRMDYGKTIGWHLEHPGIGQDEPPADTGVGNDDKTNEDGQSLQGGTAAMNVADSGKEAMKSMTVTVTSPNGGPVNLRRKPDRGAALADRIPAGTEAETPARRGLPSCAAYTRETPQASAHSWSARFRSGQPQQLRRPNASFR